MVHGVEFPGEALGAERVGDLGCPVVVRVVIRVQTIVQRQPVQLRTKPVLEWLKIPLSLPPFCSSVLEPNLKKTQQDDEET